MSKEQLTKEQMRAAIDEGGSVLHEGQLLRTHAHVDRITETEDDIDAQIAELEARKAAKAEAAQQTEGGGDELSKDFPGYAELETGGVTLTKTAISSLSDDQLLSIKGIGSAKLAAIRDALK